MKFSKKNYKKNKSIILILLVLLILFIVFITNKIYTTIKCKDLNYSVNYYLTKDTLLRVQDYYVTFSNNNMLIIKAYGLSKDSPHKSLIIQGRFEKNSANSWILEQYSICK